MNEIKKQIDELKQMQQFPRFHLSKYFDEIKAQVDIKYASKLTAQVEYSQFSQSNKYKDKYLEIISNIESFEKEAYNNSKSINSFDNEIKLIEEKLNNSSNNLTSITKLIDEVKYKIEKILFSNKSILFIDDAQSGFFYESFLLIIDDEYIQKICFDNNVDDKYITRNQLNDDDDDDVSNDSLLTRNELNVFILKEKLRINIII